MLILTLGCVLRGNIGECFAFFVVLFFSDLGIITLNTTFIGFIGFKSLNA